MDEDGRVTPLLAHFARLVGGCRPDLVFVENVPGLQTLDADSQPFRGCLARQIDYPVPARLAKLVGHRFTEHLKDAGRVS